MWNFKTPGIPDSEFERLDDVPITKEEVRVIQLSKARLKKGFTVFDIGCGSGSISIEAAIQIESSGHVYAIDFDQNAIELTKKNLNKFNLKNVSVIFGNAKDQINKLPEADAIFVGGTGGDTKDIIKKCCEKLKPGGRIIIATILVETLVAVLDVIDTLNLKDMDITQITISKSRKTSTGTMMLARNPVTIISATL